MSSANRRERFLSVFPRIVEELTANLQKEGMPKDAVEWYQRVSCFKRAHNLSDTRRQVLDYNTPGGMSNLTHSSRSISDLVINR